MLKRLLSCHGLLILLSALAPPFALAEPATSTDAIIADRAEGGGPAGALFYMVTAIDGKRVEETALSASSRASFNRGAYMVVRGATRPVPAGKVTLELRGEKAHAAPIESLFRELFLGGVPVVAGTVTVELAPGGRYRMNGILDALRREIWIEDDSGREVTGSKVVLPPDPEMEKQMEGAVYTSTNLHYEGDWISEVPWLDQPLIPAGSRLKVIDYGSNRAKVLVDGMKMRMGVDYSRETETIQQFVARATSAEDPRPKIATFPERTRNAVRAGRVFVGMSKEQVLIALGRPRVDFVPALDAHEWKYQVSEEGDMYLVFDESGNLREIDGSRKARALITYDAQ